jgi:glycosyltransferase involved in cell wall biosynthesis
VNVLFVGRVIPNKRIDDLIRSFAVFQRWLNPRSRLLLVGDTRGFERYLGRLRGLVRELGVEEVVFTGHVDDDELYAYYRLADVFLCLSEHEGFCVPLQEAMHFSLPVIAYDAGAVRETLHGGGLLLQDKRPELVAEILDRVTHGGALRRGVLESQARAIAGIRATDFGAVLAKRLAPVVGDSQSERTHERPALRNGHE